MNRRMKGWILFLASMCLILTACQSRTTLHKAKPVALIRQSIENKTNPEKRASEPVYPLTGLPAKGPINNRVIGVMINNYYLARPQSGLQQADIVIEALAEGRITRFLALFQSQRPPIIGPVRSARPYYIQLNQGFGGIYVAFGWSPQAKSILQNGDIDYIQGLYHDGTWFKRVTFREAPHNAYTSSADLEKGAKASGFSLTQSVKPLPFLSTEEQSKLKGETVNKVTITYSSDNVVSYAYNPKDELFYRQINGKQAEDRESLTPLSAANVFIVSAKHTFIDKYPRRAIDLTSGGPAYLLQKGKLQRVEWKNVGGRLLPYKNGHPLGFVPGQTWINIVESSPGLEKEVKIE
ncbi:DUF3048 domain-containing protein [Pullulanibacillus sp. KACC 23026]|uniref:DUF3048 domain-containing protein n=1 Tax=Pullulanibacillus sp. KACC 23026 TaxID=3028315 RepID=UPI0023B1473A|nr:DUF3048 domain-containing protein [Pullulanibacillus sp. KACC 23026]WEG12387.1 DUF3048 domain-containing protein [Pullulanibacillus sp. KACC 23026]